MRKMLFLRSIILSLALTFLFISFGGFEVSAKTVDKISCGKLLCGGELQVQETIEIEKEKKILGSDGEKNYQKDITVIKQFKKHVKNNIYETKSEIRQRFKFTYDKLNSVTMSPEDVESKVTVSNWKISPVSEIFINDGICSVSNQYRVYEKNIAGQHEYIGDGYIDIFCDCQGEVGINSDVR